MIMMVVMVGMVMIHVEENYLTTMMMMMTMTYHYCLLDLPVRCRLNANLGMAH
jgi:hypothetical protein